MTNIYDLKPFLWLKILLENSWVKFAWNNLQSQDLQIKFRQWAPFQFQEKLTEKMSEDDTHGLSLHGIMLGIFVTSRSRSRILSKTTFKKIHRREPRKLFSQNKGRRFSCGESLKEIEFRALDLFSFGLCFLRCVFNQTKIRPHRTRAVTFAVVADERIEDYVED